MVHECIHALLGQGDFGRLWVREVNQSAQITPHNVWQHWPLLVTSSCASLALPCALAPSMWVLPLDAALACVGASLLPLAARLRRLDADRKQARAARPVRATRAKKVLVDRPSGSKQEV